MDSPTISSRPDVTVATTAPRVTPTPERGVFKKVLTQSLVRGAETAMKVLPGGPLMAVAVRVKEDDPGGGLRRVIDAPAKRPVTVAQNK